MDDIKYKFLKSIHEIYPLKQDDFKLFMQKFKIKSYKKGDKILAFGQVENKMSIIYSGITYRSIKIDNKVLTLDISLSGSCMCNLKSYLEESPSLETQIALTDVDIIYMEKDTIEKLIYVNHTYSYITSKFREIVYLQKDNRLDMLQHKDACKRFEFFMKTNKNAKRYLKEVPQRLIAEYLNLAPETLSRVKKKYFNQNLIS